MLALRTRDLPGGASCARVAWLMTALEDNSDGMGGSCGSGGAGAGYGGGGRPLPSCRNLQNTSK